MRNVIFICFFNNHDHWPWSWPWPRTCCPRTHPCSWPPKLISSCLCPVHQLCQLASRSVRLCSKYRVHNVDNRTNERTDGRTNGHVENIMLPPACVSWRRHKIKYVNTKKINGCAWKVRVQSKIREGSPEVPGVLGPSWWERFVQ